MKPFWHGWRLPKRGQWALECHPFASGLPEIPLWIFGAVLIALGIFLRERVLWWLPVIGITTGNLLATTEAATQRLESSYGLGSAIGPYVPAFNVKSAPFFAKGDSTSDDTAAIQSALTAAGNLGGGIVFFPVGNYQISQPLKLPSFVTMQGISPDYLQNETTGCILRVISNGIMAGQAVVDVSNTVWGTIAQLKFEVAGNNPAFNTTQAIDEPSGGCSFLAIDRCHFQWFGGPIIKLVTPGGVNVVTRNRGNNNGSHFIWIPGGSDYFIAWNESGALQSGTGDGLRIDGGGNNTVHGNHFYNMTNGVNITGATPAYNNIVGNRCEKNTLAGINLESGARGNQIVGNWCFNNGTTGTGQGINVKGASIDTLVEGNYCYQEVANSNFGNQSAGIQLSGNATRCHVVGNFTRNNQLNGIQGNSISFCTIEGNYDSLSQQQNINLTSATDCKIDNNTCETGGQQTDNTYDGIILVSGCTNCSVNGNFVRSGGGAAQIRFGIRINAASCTNCRVMNNDLRSSGKTGAISDAGVGTMKHGNWFTTGALSGTAVLVAGTVTVSTAEIQAGDNVILTNVGTGGTVGTLSRGTITAGTSFVINSSSGTDTSTVYWEIRH
jgi:hypothetical protein